MNAAPDKDLTGAQSVDRALRLLSLVGRAGERGIGLAEVVEASGINKPTARRLLLALIRAGLVHQAEDDRRYHLGEEAYILGTLASPRFGLLRLAMPSLSRLALKTGDTTFLSARRDPVSVCLHREEGTFPIRTHALQVGYEHPLGVGAGSLAILAALPEAEAETMLQRNAAVLEARFPAVTPDALRRHVELARARGYAVNPGLILVNSWGVGAAIRHPDGSPLGALSIAAIDGRMQPPRQGELGQLLTAEAAIVERALADRLAPAAVPSVSRPAPAGPARPLRRRSPK